MNTLNTKSARPLITDWQQIDWERINQYVEKLQKRIYHAERVKNIRRVRDLQRMLMNSEAALLVSIYGIMKISYDKRIVKTEEYDRQNAFTPKEKMEIFIEMQGMKLSLHHPKYVYSTYGNIKEKDGKILPLEKAIIRDRVYQHIVWLALEPQWKAKFELISYERKLESNGEDAMQRVWNGIKDDKNQWAFIGNFKRGVDAFYYDCIMNQIQSFPEADLLAKWLKAGIVKNYSFKMLSSLLTDIALYGMESEWGIGIPHRNRRNDGKRIPYIMYRYADDFLIMCETKKEADDLCQKFEGYLSEKKDRIAHITEGIDFFGFHIKKNQTGDGVKWKIKPSKKAISRFQMEVKEIVRSSYGNNVQTLIHRLNPVIFKTAREWSRTDAKEVCSAMDRYIWQRVYHFLRRSHPKKSWKWIKEQYLQSEILTDPNTKNELKKMSKIFIASHASIEHKN